MRKTIFITGGSKRIGGFLSAELSYNYDIVLHSRKIDDEVLSFKKLLESRGASVELFEADFQEIDILEQKLKLLNNIDILINNAAMFRKDEEDNYHRSLKSHFSVNFLAPTLMIKHFKCRGLKSVINILDSSFQSFREQCSAYILSKAALLDYTRSIYSQGFLRVNGISLPALLFKEGQNLKIFNEFSIGVRDKEILFQEFIDTVKFLILDENMNGQVIEIK